MDDKPKMHDDDRFRLKLPKELVRWATFEFFTPIPFEALHNVWLGQKKSTANTIEVLKLIQARQTKQAYPDYPILQIRADVKDG